MTSDKHQRYARHIALPHIGEAGQQALLDAHVLIVGMGGLGSPAALYLAASGVGTLTLCDYDQVDLSNLQRQVVHRQANIGELKAHSARANLRALNPDISIHTVDYLAEEDELEALARNADIILDCTDNFPSRFGLNRVSLATRTPLVSGAAIRWEGQITCFDPQRDDSPCYHCLYPDTGAESASCAQEGVVAPLVGVIGTLQAQEAINLLLGHSTLVGRVLLYDARSIDWQAISLNKNPNCPVCQPDPAHNPTPDLSKT